MSELHISASGDLWSGDSAEGSDVPQVTNDQLRHIWGWLSSCPGERPLAAALEQALASARREYPDTRCRHCGAPGH